MANTKYMKLEISDTGINGDSLLEASQKINLNWVKLDVHDHTLDNGTRIPAQGIDINEDLSFNFKSAKDVRAVNFYNHSSLDEAADIPVNSLFSVNRLFYFKDERGNILDFQALLNNEIDLQGLIIKRVVNTIRIFTNSEGLRPATPEPVAVVNETIPDESLPLNWRRLPVKISEAEQELTGILYEAKALIYSDGTMIFSPTRISDFNGIQLYSERFTTTPVDPGTPIVVDDNFNPSTLVVLDDFITGPRGSFLTTEEDLFIIP